MLEICLPAMEIYDASLNQFTDLPTQTLQLEHSLISLSKWESKWKKPFLTNIPKTEEEVRDYIRCMTLTRNVNPLRYQYLPASVFDQIHQYIDDPMTATTINDSKRKPVKKRTVTAELIYHWMIALGIPFECQKWNLNRLMTLIRVCEIENGGGKKMSKKDIYAQNRAINAARLAQYGGRG